jgi:ligand-binding sensor domain-containing protein
MPHLLRQRPAQSIIWATLALMLALSACTLGGSEPVTSAGKLTATVPPVATATSAPTPTPTPIPAPEGVWSQYWNGDQIYDLVLDSDGALWARGLGAILRWDPSAGTYEEMGIAQGLPTNTADAMFLGPDGKVWLSIDGYGLWHPEGTEWMNYLEQGEIEGTHLYACGIGKNGVLWTCTDEGFSSFDGEEWNAIHQEGGLTRELCAYLTVDDDGNLWMQGTLGISAFFGDRIEFQEPDIGLDTSDPLGAFTAPNGDLWFAYGKDYVINYDVSEGKWYAEKQRPVAMALASDGQPWIIDYGGGLLEPNDLQTYEYGTYARGDILSGEELQLYVGFHWHLPFYGETPGGLYQLYSGVNKEMWVTSDEGLLLIRGDAFELIPLSEGVNDLVPFGRGKAYLALTSGIAIFDGGQIVDWLKVGSPMLSNSILELAVDGHGTLWIGAYAGLQSFDGSTWTMHELPDNWIYDLKAAPNGDIWVSYGSGFARWDGMHWEYFERGEVAGLPDARVYEIAAASDGTIWVAFNEAGCAAYDGAAWKFYAFPEEEIPDTIRALAVDADGRVIVSADTALYILDGETWTMHEQGVRVEALAVGIDGTVWAGTTSGGLSTFVDGELLPTEYPAKTARALVRSPDGSIWAASYDGAWRYDGFQWDAYTIEDGLRSNHLTAIAAGPDGTLWFGGAGLTRFGPAP